MKKMSISLFRGASTIACLTALSACGGATPEAETPVEEPPEAALMDEPTAPPTEDEAAASNSEPVDDSTPASREDIQIALQLVIQDDALQDKMDLGVAGRFPIKISGSDIPVGIELTSREKGVEVIPTPEDPKTEPVLIFTKIEMTSTNGVFKFRYDVEGLRGTALVTKTDGRWELKSSRVSEYFRKSEEE